MQLATGLVGSRWRPAAGRGPPGPGVKYGVSVDLDNLDLWVWWVQMRSFGFNLSVGLNFIQTCFYISAFFQPQLIINAQFKGQRGYHPGRFIMKGCQRNKKMRRPVSLIMKVWWFGGSINHANQLISPYSLTFR